jgi:SMODS and SLOG-associating 2TM effector domain 1
METQPQPVTPILQTAWTRFAQLSEIASKRAAIHLRLRRGIAALAVLATFFAILSERFGESFSPLVGWIIKLLLVTSPILASGLAAYVSKNFSTGDWLVARAGAEEILKEIYAYRTILQKTPTRRVWLEKRLAEIQRSVYRGMNGELLMETYQGILPPPPRFDPENPESDHGFEDLSGQEYFRYRLEDQLGWHVRSVNKKQKERTRLQRYILLAGGIGALLAAMGGPLTLWVALAAAFTAAFNGWQELRDLDSVVRNYSKVIIELNILSDHWKNLEGEEQSRSEFFKTVRATEDVLWSQNVEYIKAMQKALRDSDLEAEAGLINRVIQEQRDSDQRFRNTIEDAVVGQTRDSMNETNETLTETYKSALGTLAEEASSELVQAELASMQNAVHDVVENIAEHLGMTSAIRTINDEFEGVEIGSNTPPNVLNDLISRYPKTTDAKG